MSTPDSRFNLANLISLMVSYDHEAELARIRLAREDDLDLFHYYRKIDRSKNGFINKTDFAIFLNSYGIFPPDKSMDKFFRRGRDNGLKITYNDLSFINQLLPVLEPELKKQCLARSGDTYTEYSSSVEKSLESKIATIYSKEAELALQLQEALHDAPKSFDVDDFVFTLCDPLTGFLDFTKIKELMNEFGFEFDQQRFDYLVNRLCINTVNRISPSDLLRYLFPEKFLQSKPPAPKEETHHFKFATRPFTISQRPASASKPHPLHEASPLQLEDPSNIYATQPRKSTHQSNLDDVSSPIKPIDFPDLSKLPPVDNTGQHSQRNSAIKSQATGVKESFTSPNNKEASSGKLSNLNIMNESLNTGKFPNYPGQNEYLADAGLDDYKTKYLHQKPFEKSRITAAGTLDPQNTSLNVSIHKEKERTTVHDPYAERIAPQFRASNIKSVPNTDHLHANRNETFGIKDNPDLIARLTANAQPQSGANQSVTGRTTATATLYNKYSNVPTSYLQAQEPVAGYDYRQGFYTSAANAQTGNTNFSPLLEAPLKYTRESNLQTGSAYGQTYSNESNKASLSLEANTYNAPARFYSPKYTRADYLQVSQTGSNENASKYASSIEQKAYKYIPPLSSQVQGGLATQSALTAINRSQYETPYGKGALSQSQNLQNSAQAWKDKIEMSRKVKGESAYKFSNDAYGKLWKPVDEH